MRRLSLAFAAAALFLASACSGTKAGDPCSNANAGLCEDNKTALFCNGTAYVAVPCRGASGCAIGGGQLNCDLVVQLGDACPPQLDGSAICDPANSAQAIQCSGGVWTAVGCPSQCVESSGQISCQ